MTIKGATGFGIRDNHTHGKVADFIKDKIELNLIVDGDRDRTELKECFDSIWADERPVLTARPRRPSCRSKVVSKGGEGGKPDTEGGKRTLPGLPPGLTGRLPKPGQRLSTDALQQLIRDLCGWQPLRGEELATLPHKDLKYLRDKHLTEMLEGGELAFLFPESPNHALQAYTLPPNKEEGS